MIKPSGQLKHKLLREDLMRRLVGMNPGDAFLSVREIMDEFAVSQATVTKAVEGLCEEGLLDRNVGLGTFVTDEVLRHKKGAPPVICLALPRWESSFLIQIENHFSSMANAFGYEAAIMQYDWRENAPQRLPDRKVDALLIIPSGRQMSSQELDKLNAFGKPLAIFGREFKDLAIDSVYSDDNYAGALAASQLLKLGHKKIAAIVSEPRSVVIAARLDGFKTHCAIHGVKVEEIDCGIAHGDFNMAKVYAKTKELLKEGALTQSGLFVTSAPPAMAVLKALYERGVKVPEDISLISCNGDSLSAFFHPSLTVINDPVEKMVEGALKLLLARLSGKGKAEMTKLNHKPELVEGGSCAIAKDLKESKP